ncbi:MAG: sensor domain-containing diguanylate cyclase [Janthinobacterium lividum]
MKQNGAFSAVAALAFFSLVVFGYGVLQHGAVPVSVVVSKSQVKPVVSGHRGKGKAPVKAAAVKSAAQKAVDQKAAAPGGVGSRAFPAMLAGGIGLLLSVLASLVLSHLLGVTQPQAARRAREAETADRKKQQIDFEDQRITLMSQLQEAKQRKSETEAHRDQVSRQFQEFFRTLPVPCFCFAANGRIIRWNAACESLYGIPAASALESTLWDTIVPPAEREEAEAKLSRVLAGESLLGMERWDTVSGGELCRLRCSMVPLYDAEGIIIGGLSAGIDITELSQYEQQITTLNAELEAAHAVTEKAILEAPAESVVPAAVVDVGTPELSGHPAFRAKLTGEIDRAARYHSPLSLVVLDLDNFAARNRTYGFEAGDQALRSALAAIKSKIRTVDVVARLGADEYAIILPETGEAGARVAAERLRAGVAATSSSGQPPLTACFGVTQLTPEVSGAEALVNRALEALESARFSGSNTVMHYQDMPENSASNGSYETPGRQKTR